MASDTTFVVTGHLHPNSLQVLPIYSQVAKHIILSCFHTDNYGMFYTYPLPEQCKIILLSNPTISDDTKQGVKEFVSFQQPFSDNTFYQHVYLQQAAIPYVTTKYVIFVKSDEFYTNWESLLRCMKENPFKLTFVSTGCQKMGTFPYLFSKHIIAGRADLLQGACVGLWEMITKQQTDLVRFHLNVLHIPTPSFFVDLVQLYVACFFHRNEIPYPKSHDERSMHLRDWICVVPIQQMGMYAYNMGSYEEPIYITENTPKANARGIGFESLNASLEDVVGEKNEEDHLFTQAVMACKSFHEDDWFQCLEIAERIGKIDFPQYRNIIEEANHQANLG